MSTCETTEQANSYMSWLGVSTRHMTSASILNVCTWFVHACKLSNTTLPNLRDTITKALRMVTTNHHPVLSFSLLPSGCYRSLRPWMNSRSNRFILLLILIRFFFNNVWGVPANPLFIFFLFMSSNSKMILFIMKMIQQKFITLHLCHCLKFVS